MVTDGVSGSEANHGKRHLLDQTCGCCRRGSCTAVQHSGGSEHRNTNTASGECAIEASDTFGCRSGRARGGTDDRGAGLEGVCGCRGRNAFAKKDGGASCARECRGPAGSGANAGTGAGRQAPGSSAGGGRGGGTVACALDDSAIAESAGRSVAKRACGCSAVVVADEGLFRDGSLRADIDAASASGGKRDEAGSASGREQGRGSLVSVHHGIARRGGSVPGAVCAHISGVPIPFHG